MTHYICVTCGTQYAESANSTEPPSGCPICQDERQYIGMNGQQWTTLEDLRKDHRNEFKPQGERILGIGSTPKIAIAQRALLVQTSEGNLLWDCITLVDEATVEQVNALGGLKAIAISHPHYYSGMIEWSQRFGGVPIYLHTADQEHVMRLSSEIEFWQGETLKLFGGITLIRCGGHFEGGTVAHWAEGEGGQGSLLTGDIINVVQDRRYVSFMRSYPNQIPLNAKAVAHIVEAVEPFPFERVYGAWWEMIVQQEAKAAVKKSAERYVRAIGGRGKGAVE